MRDQIDKYYVCVPYLMDITSHKMTTSDEHKFSENETKKVNVQVLRLTHHVSIDNDLIHFIKRFRPHPPEGVMYFTQKGWYTNSFNENPDLLLLVCMNFTFKVWYTSHLGFRKTILVVLVRDQMLCSLREVPGRHTFTENEANEANSFLNPIRFQEWQKVNTYFTWKGQNTDDSTANT